MQLEVKSIRPATLRGLAIALFVSVALATFAAGCGGGNVKTDAKKNAPAANKDAGQNGQDGSGGGDGSGSK